MSSDIKQLSRADVAARDGRGGNPVWVIYKDSVYDVTAYLREHPGGDDVLQEEAGKDVSKTFDEVGHSGDARAIMAKHKIGEIIEEERQYDASGKKRKVAVPAETGSRSCLSICTCGLLG